MLNDRVNPFVIVISQSSATAIGSKLCATIAFHRQFSGLHLIDQMSSGQSVRNSLQISYDLFLMRQMRAVWRPASAAGG